MNNREKFIERFEEFQYQEDATHLVDGSYETYQSDIFGPMIRTEVQNHYDFDGLAELSTVYYIQDLDLYVRFNGWYRSFHGTEFRNYHFVTPKEKTIIVYE